MDRLSQLACLGLDDMLVVDTADALLVTRLDRAQDVRAVVDRLKSKGRGKLL